MPTSGPLAFSMMMTAGTSAVLTAADFASGTPFQARLSNVAYLTKITLDYDYSSAGPHYLILSPDSARTAIATPTSQPLWVQAVWPNNQAAAASTYPRLPIEIIFLQPLLAGNQIDFYFQTARWPDSATFFKPSALNLSIEYSPFNRVV